MAGTLIVDGYLLREFLLLFGHGRGFLEQFLVGGGDHLLYLGRCGLLDGGRIIQTASQPSCQHHIGAKAVDKLSRRDRVVLQIEQPEFEVFCQYVMPLRHQQLDGRL